jgi:hypothetical protein
MKSEMAEAVLQDIERDLSNFDTPPGVMATEHPRCILKLPWSRFVMPT